MQPPHPRDGCIERAGAHPGLLGDELETASQLTTEQSGRGGSVGAPPLCCLADLPLRVGSDQQPQAQELVSEIVEELPAVDDFAAVGLADGF